MGINSPATGQRCGVIAIVGKPNVGKSTLLNALVGQKISITSRKAQTTRHRITGVRTAGAHQYIFVDTPGFQTRHSNALNKNLNKAVTSALSSVDVVLVVVEAGNFTLGDAKVLALLPQDTPVLLLANKLDQIKHRADLMRWLKDMQTRFPFAEIVPLSAKKPADMQRLLGILAQYLPEQEWLYQDGQISDKSERFLVAEIVRENLRRQIRIDGNPLGRSTGEVASEIENVLRDIKWEPGYGYSVAGDAQDSKESAGYAASALILAVIFIYMVLASQFNSFVQPIAIMSSLPLSLVGVFLALLMFNSTLNIFSIVGFVLLMGLVTKNAILLVDFVNQERARGIDRTQAIIDAAHIRLRPILMTTLAMIFGMLPLALALGEGSARRAPMGQAVIGGVITSTLLTLVVVPMVYTYLDDWSERLRQWWHRHVPHEVENANEHNDTETL